MEHKLLVALGHVRPVFWACDDKGAGKKPHEMLTVDIEKTKAESMGTFFAVNELGDQPNDKGNLRHKDNVVRPLACFADFDKGTYEEQFEKITGSPIEPSAIVKSGHGYHLYWFLEGATKEDLSLWTKVQLSIAAHFGTDTQVNDPARLMRLPGSYHCKDSEPKEVLLEKCDPALKYSLAELATEFPPEAQIAPHSDYGVAKVLNSTTQAGERFSASQKVIGKILNKFPPTEWESEGWPLVKAWNKTCAPPKAEHIVRQAFEGIMELELKKRATEEKGVETFAEGEMIPTVYTEGESVIITIPIEDGLAKFTFDNIEQSKSKEMEVLLSVETVIPGSYPRPFTLRVNLFSGSSLESFARSLGKSFGKDLKWDHLLNTAQAAVLKHLANRDLSLDLSEIVDEETPILFDPFLVKNGANLLFGDGGTGKTFFCLRLALSLATGKEFLGYIPKEVCPTLFVDYEDNEQTASYRLSRLCADPSLNLDPKLAKKLIRYMNPQGAPLHTIVPALKKIIAEHNIGLILVDSVASACGAEPEKAEAASNYYNALKSLNITSLSIAHIVKTEGRSQDKAFGSVFWHNLARNTWNIQGEEAEEEIGTLEGVLGEKSRQLGLFHRKYNGGAKSRPINMKITYGLKDVRFEEGKMGYFDKDKKVQDRILSILSLTGGRTKAELAEDLLDVQDKTLKNVLSELKQKGLVLKDETRGGKYTVNSRKLG